MKEYGWTDEEFDDQPEDIILAIRVRRQVEAELRKKQNDEMQRRIHSAKH